jgi:hypothetical protein
MPIELEFTNDGLGVIYECEGSLGLQHFADANSRLLASPDRIKVALIAEQGAVLGLARMWEAFVEGIGWETKIFPSLAEAETWVRDRLKAKFKLDIAQFTAKK